MPDRFWALKCYSVSFLQKIHGFLFICKFRYERIDVDFEIVPTAGLCKSCIECFCELPKILKEEEKELYEKTKSVSLDFTSKIFNEAG